MTGQKPEWEVLGMIDLNEVAEAIVQRDPEAARRAMVRHLENARQRYQQSALARGADRPSHAG